MTNSLDVECLVIGAGVVGIAVARALSQQGKEVLLIESASHFGTGISSRNSEVIHAGIYYPPNSLKAKLCLRGKTLLYQFCEQHHVPHQILGKLLVATDETEVAQLHAIKSNAEQCGINDLSLLKRDDVKVLEPNLHCQLALLSPSTGIVDSHALMLTLLGEAENAGAQLVLNSPLQKVDIKGPKQFECYFNDSEQTRLRCAYLINVSGLHATELAKQFNGLDQKYIPQAHYYCKGQYFSYAGKSPFKHLIYPMPDKDGLGIHLTIDLGGQIKFGPDAVWVDSENYDVDSTQADSFYRAVRRYWPDLKDGSLQAAYAGIRPKLSAPNQAATDFIISFEEEHGIAGLVNLFGIESPGLTATMAIAELISHKL